jgi:hypothetical protein
MSISVGSQVTAVDVSAIIASLNAEAVRRGVPIRGIAPTQNAVVGTSIVTAAITSRNAINSAHSAIAAGIGNIIMANGGSYRPMNAVAPGVGAALATTFWTTLANDVSALAAQRLWVNQTNVVTPCANGCSCDSCSDSFWCCNTQCCHTNCCNSNGCGCNGYCSCNSVCSCEFV